jgi:hypothetical protein
MTAWRPVAPSLFPAAFKKRSSIQLALEQAIPEQINSHSFPPKLKSVKPKQRKKKRVNFQQEADPFLFKILLKNT